MTYRSPDRSLTRDSVGRHTSSAPRNDEDLHLMRRAAWRQQGVLCVPVDEVKNEIDRAFLERLGTRTYGERTKG